MITTTEELSEVLKGKIIESVELHEDGVHLCTSDGHVLILIGVSIIGMLDTGANNYTLQ